VTPLRQLENTVIRVGVAALFVLHGLILLLGFAEGVGFVSLPQLTQPVAGHWSAVACGGSALLCRARR
jgi:hypothetical protein